MSDDEQSRFELPAAVKPVWQLVVHLAIGAVAFASVLVIAVLLAGFIHLLAPVPFAPEWLTRAAEFVEQALFVLDLLTAGLFCLPKWSSSPSGFGARFAMTDRARAGKQARAETFVVDRAWLKQEAREALKTFFAPFSGVYAAFKGDSTAR